MQRTAPPPKAGIGSRLGKAALAVVLAVSLTPPLVPTTAHADTQGTTIAEQLREANAQIEAQGFTTIGSQAYNWLEDEAPAAKARNAELPAQYDLREQGVVTPVKLQNPWGTCWGFSAIAASETSILSELKNAGKDYSSSSPFYDLSERQLAWFAYSPIPANDPNGQGGEGQVNLSDNPNAPFNTGGLPVYATSIFSSGIGPLNEERVPYQNDEGNIQYAPQIDENGEYVYDDESNIVVDTNQPLYYSDQGKWAVDDELRYDQVIELEETRVLPAPAVLLDTDDDLKVDRYEYNADATEAIKQELLDGRAVSIAFCADQSMPGQVTEQGYMNPETWAHYTYTPKSANHAVTIVGWDDTYSASNFNPDHQQPSGDGAWIVKNSWGASNNAFPHQMDWGIDGSGYFYLSYYDQSIVSAETFDYDINSIDSEAESYYNNTYDYLPISTSFNETSSDKISTANVFAAEGDQTVRTLACETTLPNTTVTYELYKLNENHSNPTDGYRVAEITKTYEYGGFHRVDLTEEQQFKVPQGSTFSVVVTQKSGDNYYYTLDGGYNEAYVDMYNGILEEQYTRVVEQIAQAAFASEYGHAYVEGSSEEEEDAAMQAFRDGAWQLLELFGQISYVKKNSTRAYLQEVPLNIAHNNGGHIHELCATPSLFTCNRGFIGVFFASCLFLKTNFEQYSHSHLGYVRFIRAKRLPEVMNRPYVRINHKNIERT